MLSSVYFFFECINKEKKENPKRNKKEKKRPRNRIPNFLDFKSEHNFYFPLLLSSPTSGLRFFTHLRSKMS
ncbi:hypothetical protein GQ457_03G032560 [Hibiscus cannabinus]